MELLDNPVRRYAWGSRTVIAGLRGLEVPSPHPEAELWLGAHPGDPSYLVGRNGQRSSLLDEITKDPIGRLGEQGSQRWEGRLPFLFKVLAADEPLSLQAHPDMAGAVAGFQRENAQGIALDDARRSYKDNNHKPELVCALTEFHALTGFRDPAATVELLRELNVPQLAAHVELLAGQPDARGLRALFSTWITLPQGVLDQLVPAVQEGCVALLRRAGADGGSDTGAGATGAGRFRAEARTVLELSESYPGDAGVLAALLLNRVTLAPGEAMFQDAGLLHAYLSGACIELMANSDNVLRGGLTPKHVDVPELLRVLHFEAGPAPHVIGVVDGPVTRYDTKVEEFRLWRLDWSGPNAGDVISLPEAGPRIALCTEGSVKVSASSGSSLTLRRGDSVWLDAKDVEVKAASVDGSAQLFLATDGLHRG